MRLLFVSNGHGEDVIASRLALHIREAQPDLRLEAFPLVGSGRAWREAGIRIVGEARELPSGGLTFHSGANLLADLRAGLLPVTLRQVQELRLQRPDAVIVAGDVWALALSLLPKVPAQRRFVVQTLVSIRQAASGPPVPWRLFMERITAPERLLQRRNTAAVWLRDEETASWLRERNVPQARYDGSLLHDRQPASASGAARDRILLLPGSRAWAADSLAHMLPLAACMPTMDFQVAWARPEPPGQLPPGWRYEQQPQLFTDGQVRVRLLDEPLTSLLPGVTAAVATAGTAVEETVAAGIPVLSFELPGRHTGAFLRNQQRLLAGALHVVSADSPEELRAGLLTVLDSPDVRSAARTTGARILGRPGGLRNIAAEITARLSGKQEG